MRGEVEAADGATYTLQPGDAFWTGVGTIHAFVRPHLVEVRWLETQSPQPPASLLRVQPRLGLPDGKS
jgi:hypothetical protein